MAAPPQPQVQFARYREAQRAVAAAADDPELAGRARRQAQVVLRAFFAALGWDVQVRWEDPWVKGVSCIA